MNKLIKTLILSIYLTFSFSLYANANPANWSKTDNRCPNGTERYKREVGTITGQEGTYYWCYWYDGIAHNMSMRPTNRFRGIIRGRTQDDNVPQHYYKNYLFHCAQDYVNGKGFCGST